MMAKVLQQIRALDAEPELVMKTWEQTEKEIAFLQSPANMFWQSGLVCSRRPK